jgi:hypothetical protein
MIGTVPVGEAGLMTGATGDELEDKDIDDPA